MYLTYDEYTNLGGTLDETTFNMMEIQAETYVNHYTFGRFKNETTFPTELKNLMCAIVPLINAHDQTMSGIGVVASQSNDGLSTTYNSLSADKLYETTRKTIEELIGMYLDGVKNSAGKLVLFRGLYPDE